MNQQIEAKFLQMFFALLTIVHQDWDRMKRRAERGGGGSVQRRREREERREAEGF